jgi:hypothetical protein
MKEKRSKKESNKEEAKEEGHTGLDFAPLQQASPSEDLKINWEAFIRFFNATLKLHGSNIRPIAYLSKGKKSRVQSLVNHWNTKQALVDAVVNMARSDFLNGRKKGYPFIASFIWLTESDDHFEKVLNGSYDNPPATELTPDEQRQLEQERYRQQQDARRAEARRIEEEEREQRARERDERARHCVSYEEYQRMKQQGLLNP